MQLSLPLPYDLWRLVQELHELLHVLDEAALPAELVTQQANSTRLLQLLRRVDENLVQRFVLVICMKNTDTGFVGATNQGYARATEGAVSDMLFPC